MDLVKTTRHAVFALAVELVFLLPGLEAELNGARSQALHWIADEFPHLLPDCEALTGMPDRGASVSRGSMLAGVEIPTFLCGPLTGGLQP